MSNRTTRDRIQAPSLRAVLVAQSPVLRYGIRTVLESLIELDTVTEATGAIEAVAAHAGRPDLVVIHDALPGLTGIATTGMVRELVPYARIVLMSDDVTDVHRDDARRAGADCLLSMAIDPDGFALAISQTIGSRSRPDDDRLVVDRAAVAGCSAIQLGILDGIVRGMTDELIARHLRLDELTTASESDALLARLGAHDRASAMSAAIRLGLVDLADQLPPPAFSPDFGFESAA